MLSTYVSYQLIAKDLTKALNRVESQPVVDRETKYYQENITKVTSIEEFVKDDRLFRYAMKAHGLEEMTYAKAFMVKALKEGVRPRRQLCQQALRQALCRVCDDFQFRRATVRWPLSTTRRSTRPRQTMRSRQKSPAFRPTPTS